MKKDLKIENLIRINTHNKFGVPIDEVSHAWPISNIFHAYAQDRQFIGELDKNGIPIRWTIIEEK